MYQLIFLEKGNDIVYDITFYYMENLISYIDDYNIIIKEILIIK